MSEQNEYRFVIDEINPDTLPMSRLAEYMGELARFLGEIGTSALRAAGGGKHRARPDGGAGGDARSKRTKIHSLTYASPPSDVVRAFNALNRYLAEDNAAGSLQKTEGAEVIRFPGCERPAPATFGAFNQLGVLDGVLIRIGGRDDTVSPFTCAMAPEFTCATPPAGCARRLAVHLYGPTLRVQGDGRWERDADGGWVMKRFNITNFEQLDDASLGQVAQRLRDVDGSGSRRTSKTLRRSFGPSSPPSGARSERPVLVGAPPMEEAH